jgi:NADH:ubiquinone oxidoreductase subunit 5 (subunit L)/multisubunit Na+/H+ antiporter MnhA subunit
MNSEVAVVAAVLTPVLGSLVLPVLGKVWPWGRNLLACLLIAVSASACVWLAPWAMSGQTVDVAMPFAGLGQTAFHADALAVFVGIVSSCISLIIAIYSTSYISHYKHQNEYYFMVVLFLGAMMGLVFAANLIVLYVFWEITAISSWRLIGFFREKYQVVRADKAFLVTVFGALAMLLGFVMLGTTQGSFDLGALKGSTIPDLAVLLILAGLLSKSATLPFHTWLPDAGVAPSPVTALLHAAVLVKIGVYVYARLFVDTFTLSFEWQSGVMMVAAASALVSAGAALIDTDLKRIIAYSTVSQIAFIFLGLASGTQIGVAGGLLYILMHGIAKGGLFLCAGIVEQKTHVKDITRLGGLIRTMPVTAISFLLCALSVMGVPPFGGFFSKLMVISGGVAAGQTWIAIVFIVGAFMTIAYLLRVFNMVFLGEPRGEVVREGSPVMVVSVALLAVLSLASGILFTPSADFARTAVSQMLGF